MLSDRKKPPGSETCSMSDQNSVSLSRDGSSLEDCPTGAASAATGGAAAGGGTGACDAHAPVTIDSATQAASSGWRGSIGTGISGVVQVAGGIARLQYATASAREAP